jgi:hypothetical protein
MLGSFRIMTSGFAIFTLIKAGSTVTSFSLQSGTIRGVGYPMVPSCVAKKVQYMSAETFAVIYLMKHER